MAPFLLWTTRVCCEWAAPWAWKNRVNSGLRFIRNAVCLTLASLCAFPFSFLPSLLPSKPLPPPPTPTLTHPSTPSRLLIPPDLSRSHSRALALALVLSAAMCMCTWIRCRSVMRGLCQNIVELHGSSWLQVNLLGMQGSPGRPEGDSNTSQ